MANELKEISTGAEQTDLQGRQIAPALADIIEEIDSLFSDIQKESVRTIWRVGQLICSVRDKPETYLTDEQRSAHIDAEAVIISVFAPVYSVEHIRSAISIFEQYPEEGALNKLLSLRCPERPRWRLTTSHVQLLSQIPDLAQRQAVEKKCAEEAYTARALAHELHELRGKNKSGAGRPHEAPKGLKQQLQDLINHQQRFITRSTSLWLSEDKDNIYDEIVNTPASKINDAICESFDAIESNFDTLRELMDEHIGMCRKVRGRVFDKLDAASVESSAAAEDD
ncbi:hypothetical protein EBZ39_02180 [bacterium]|nr:hypothetical protein [bacterium]